MKKFRFLFITCLLLAAFTTSLFSQRKSPPPMPEYAPNSYKSLAAPCAIGNTITWIALNNVSAPVHTRGVLWQTPEGIGGYEIPKGSGKTIFYSGGIWIAGTDVNEQIKVAAVRYISARNYWPGPLITDGLRRGTTDVEVCYVWDTHYEIARHQVADFRSWYNASDEEKSRDWEG